MEEGRLLPSEEGVSGRGLERCLDQKRGYGEVGGRRRRGWAVEDRRGLEGRKEGRVLSSKLPLTTSISSIVGSLYSLLFLSSFRSRGEGRQRKHSKTRYLDR